MSAISGTARRGRSGAQRRRAGLVRAGDADQVGPGLLAAADLVDRRRWRPLVSVLVMVWTVIGASPPTGTLANHDLAACCGARYRARV
jgi:hypothetical protein